MKLEDKIKNIVKYEYMNFMKCPNVVGVGYSTKYINNIDTGQPCIKVYVKYKNLDKYNSLGAIPKYYNSIPTDVVESGEFTALGFDTRIRPVKMGYIIIPNISGKVEAGTAGCIVKKNDSNKSNDLYILGCNHIMAQLNKLPKGTKILQPVPIGVPREEIAVLEEFIPIKLGTSQNYSENYIDAAIAKISDISITTPQIAFIGIPKGKEYSVSQYEPLKKSGASTGYTTGNVDSESASIKLMFANGEAAYLVDQIISTKMSEGGDSGSVVLNNRNYVVGMVCGGSKDSTVINKIKYIEKLLNVEVYTQS